MVITRSGHIDVVGWSENEATLPPFDVRVNGLAARSCEWFRLPRPDVIARLFHGEHFWAVAAFILPLVFARQMFFRSMALEEAGKELKDRERVLRAVLWPGCSCSARSS